MTSRTMILFVSLAVAALANQMLPGAASGATPPSVRGAQSAGVQTATQAETPRALSLENVPPFDRAALSADETLWYNRLIAGMDGSKLLIEDVMRSNDLYSIGREGGNYIQSMIMAFRSTGDPRFLDRALELTEIARGTLQDAWLDGTRDGFTDWLWLADTNNATYYGKDTNWLDESNTAGNVAFWMYAFHANRNRDPRYAAAADFWRDWLENQFLAKWYTRAGGDTLGAWNVPFKAFYKPDTEPRSANWRLAYYLWRVTGRQFYKDRADAIVAELRRAQELNPAHPTAYRWARQIDYSTGDWQAINYANYYGRVIIEMNLEGMPFYSSPTEMARFAATYRDVVYAGSLPDLTTMTSNVNGDASAAFALYAFAGYAAWDNTAFLLNLADKSIVGAASYAAGGRSKAARNDTYTSAYTLLALSLGEPADVTPPAAIRDLNSQ